MTNQRINYEITATNKTAAAFAKVRSSINNIAKVGAVAGAAFGAAFVTAYQSAASDIDKLAKTASRLGIGTEELAGLRHAAELTGVSVETTEMALQRMVRRVAEAANGTGEAVGALDELGISATYLASLSPDEQFKAIADEMNGVANQGDRVRLAMKLFDSEGVALVNTLRLGSEGLNEAAAEAQSFGVALSSVDVARIEAANDEMTRVKKVFTGVQQQIAVQFAPIVGALGNKFIDAANDAGGVEEAVKNASQRGIMAFGKLQDVVHGVSVTAKGLQLAFSVVGTAITVTLSSIYEGWNILFSGMTQGISDLVHQANTVLPASLKLSTGVLDSMTRSSEGAIASMQEMQSVAISSTARISQEFQDKLMEPLPSASIEAWVSDFSAKFDQSIAAHRDAGELSINPLEGTLDALMVDVEPYSAPWIEAANDIDGAFGSAFDSAASAAKFSIASMVTSGGKLQDVFSSVANTITGSLIGALVDMGIQWVKNQVLSQSSNAAAAAGAAATGTAIAASYAPAAAAASLATAGANSVPASAGMASTFALSKSLSLASFDGGGSTGNGIRAGGVDGKGGFPAIVHPNEEVIDHHRGGGGQRPVTFIFPNVKDEKTAKRAGSQAAREFNRAASAFGRYG